MNFHRPLTLIDGVVKELPAGGLLMGAPFVIWAEENAALGNGTYEWAFGNGANTNANGGIVFPFAVELFALGLNVNNAAAVADVCVVKNATIMTAYNVTLAAERRNWADHSASPLAFAAGDWMTFRTVSSSSTSGPATAHAWMRPTG